MTPQQLATLHARVSATPWSAQSFSDQLGQSGALFTCCDNAFAIGRAVLDEAELFQIATAPEYQKQGLGKQMLTAFEQSAKAHGCTRAFLEVAQSNVAAQRLYTTSGWSLNGRRKSYYKCEDGSFEDALLMSKGL